MLAVVLRIFLLVLFLTPVKVNAQKTKIITYKSVKYKPNVDAPLNSTELDKIKEVYQEHTQQLVIGNLSHLKRIKHLLRNRIKIIKIDIVQKQRNYKLLSDVQLFNHYNEKLRRDINFHKNSFNPLKYNFDFYASENKLYRIDGTDYFVQIKSQFQ